MTFIQVIPGNFTITDPDVPVYSPMEIVTSDDFSGSDGEVFGTMTSAALGGEPSLWSGTTQSGWARSGGQLVGTPGVGGFGNLQLGSFVEGMRVEITVASLPVPDSGWLYISFRKTAEERVIFEVKGTGLFQIRRRLDGVNTILAESSVPVSAGDKIAFSIDSGVAKTYVNGTETANAAIEIAPAHIALSYLPDGNGIVIDDLVIKVPAQVWA